MTPSSDKDLKKIMINSVQAKSPYAANWQVRVDVVVRKSQVYLPDLESKYSNQKSFQGDKSIHLYY
jgi:hypothetical protein